MIDIIKTGFRIMRNYTFLKTNLITGLITPTHGYYICPHKIEPRDLMNNHLVIMEYLGYKIYDFYSR